MADIDPKMEALVARIAASDDEPQYRNETPEARKARHQQMVVGYLAANRTALDKTDQTGVFTGPTSMSPVMLTAYLAAGGVCATLCQLYYVSQDPSGVNLGALAVFGALAALGIVGFLRRRPELSSADITWRTFQGVVIAACCGLFASGGLHKVLAQ